jgi:hypothetical protein
MLYSPKYVQIEDDTFIVNKGIFLGTKSGHKLFSILIDSIFGSITREYKQMINTVPIVVVDDILIPLNHKLFKHAEQIL